MKRSRINRAMKDMEQVMKEQGFRLPPFADWVAADWKSKGHEYDEIRENRLGWDITDCGLNRFDEVGFTLFTVRNGNRKAPEKYPKPYAEKLMMMQEGQTFPLHYHWEKMEDIINRGGNRVFITVYNGAGNRSRLDTPVRICRDGRSEVVPAGTRVLLSSGESITIAPYLYHDFIVPRTGGRVLLGEVSMCNDDENDNCFYEKVGRFPEIEEDEAPYHLLCNEYPEAKA